jgi:excisionase family DNA binding protein
MQERWLSVGEIAAHLGVNPDTIYKWIERKKMPAHKLGRLWKFLASEVDEWVKGGKAAQKTRNKPVARRNPKRPEAGKHPRL